MSGVVVVSGSAALSACTGTESGSSAGLPGDADWEVLNSRVGGRLLRVRNPLQPCITNPSGDACATVLDNLQNPFFNEDQPGAFQTTGWLNAFDSVPSPYAVAAESAHDIAAAVEFAREHDVRLVVKGTGHDYLGRNMAPDSLLVWTHNMRDVRLHDSYVVEGGSGAGIPAISVQAGARWLEAYTTAAGAGRYVQGGGCTSVGACGGFSLGSGFGSFSKRFGTGAGGMIEAEVVLANGRVVVANDAQNADLFWALKGGGGATFGIVTRITYLTHAIPPRVGTLSGKIQASDAAAYRRLISRYVDFYPAALNNPTWGEQVRFDSDNSMEIAMTFLDLPADAAREVWRPFTDWVDARSDEYEYASELDFRVLPLRELWNAAYWNEHDPDFITLDDRPDQPETQFWFTSNQGEVSQFLNAYESRWIPLELFEDSPQALADAFFRASRHTRFTFQSNKGLAGEHPEARARDENTALHPSAFEAAGLVLMVSNEQQAYPGVPDHEPDVTAGREAAARIADGMRVIRELTPRSGAYANEASYFQADWQEAFWGDNYPRLLEIKRKYDPDNVFRVHHGVGSES